MKSYILVLLVDDHKKVKLLEKYFFTVLPNDHWLVMLIFVVNDHDLLRFSYFQSTSDTEDPDECDGSSDPSSPSDASFVSQHALRRAELGRQLQELNKALALKEELANKMVSNDARLSNMRKQYEVSGSQRHDNVFPVYAVCRLIDWLIDWFFILWGSDSSSFACFCCICLFPQCIFSL